MSRLRISQRYLIGMLLGAIVPATFLHVVAYVNQTSVSMQALPARYLFPLAILVIFPWTSPQPTSVPTKYRLPWIAIVNVCVSLVAILAWIVFDSTIAAWLALVTFFVFALGLDDLLTGHRHFVMNIGVHVLVVWMTGAVPVILVQLNSRFAEEEFFVALQVAVLSLTFALILGISKILLRCHENLRLRGWRVDRSRLMLVFVLVGLLGSLGTVRAYQRSFYPVQAPTYPGVTREVPFICGQGQPDDASIYEGADVYQRLLALVARNPRKQAPEYGMLALGTGEQHWASEFRTAILKEADQRRFAQPAHSVKFIQYEAALRAYYYPRVRAAFPDLFSQEEMKQVKAWFADINRRAFTVEWVDGLYALAFRQWPAGPYENQENGAGLLALLEVEDLAAPELRTKNRRYLAQNPRGWQQRFHNTDDALIYQLEWLNNAYFQSLYTDLRPEKNLQLSFEWLLLQALPDGAPVGYNHLAEPSLAGVAYLGAVLLEDPRYVWLAGRAVEALETERGYLRAQPGVEASIDLVGRSPTVGGCLLYSDSGLPNQQGPLAPDKVVLRDGWTEDARYLLLNLRFTGWHRYKATNTLTLFYQNGDVIQDVTEGDAFDWLPVGRSLFRDKRIPRENLNGLVIARTGLSAVLQKLTGLVSSWAQDPPHYASVEAFEIGDERNVVHTRLADWHGWRHDRWVYYYREQNPIVIIDEASGPSRSTGRFKWHFANVARVSDQRLVIQNDGYTQEVILLFYDQETILWKKPSDTVTMKGPLSTYTTPADHRLRLITLILPEAWLGADADVDADAGRLEITMEHQDMVVHLPW